jgi:hypothetical protein
MGTRDITTTLQNALNDDVVKPFFAVELQLDSQTVRVWTGVGEATIDGNTYIGTGTLLNISTVEETSEIAVRGATLTLTGVPSDVLSLALQEQYQGRVGKLYFGIVNGTTYSELTEIFSGYMDEMNIDEGADFATIEIKLENKLIDLERARVRRFTSGYQKSLYPDDRGLDFVEDLQDKDIVWGRSSG